MDKTRVIRLRGGFCVELHYETILGTLSALFLLEVSQETWSKFFFPKQSGSLHVSGKLPTYPSPEPTFFPKSEVLMLA